MTQIKLNHNVKMLMGGPSASTVHCVLNFSDVSGLLLFHDELQNSEERSGTDRLGRLAMELTQPAGLDEQRLFLSGPSHSEVIRLTQILSLHLSGFLCMIEKRCATIKMLRCRFYFQSPVYLRVNTSETGALSGGWLN